MLKIYRFPLSVPLFLRFLSVGFISSLIIFEQTDKKKPMTVQTLIENLAQTVERLSNTGQILNKDGLETVKYWTYAAQIMVKF